jgi:hypothetical protein
MIPIHAFLAQQPDPALHALEAVEILSQPAVRSLPSEDFPYGTVVKHLALKGEHA